MVLGIKLEIDKKSIRDASNKLSVNKSKGNDFGAAAGAVIGTEIAEEERKGSKNKEGGILGMAALGGFLGAILSNLKPIRDLLSVIGGILQIFLMPVLILLKPFLVLFLRLGLFLYKLFNKSKNGDGPVSSKLQGLKMDDQTGGLAGIFSKITNFVIDILGFFGDIFFGIGFAIGDFLYNYVISPISNLITNLILTISDGIVNAIQWLMESMGNAFQWIKNVSENIWQWVVLGFQRVINFGSQIWGFFAQGLENIKDLGSRIWELLKNGLKSLANLGERIWAFIKSAMGSIFGGKSTSVNDALITSNGQIVRLNPNDNVMAFQDFKSVSDYSGKSGGNINITVHGFVGDEDTLADKISKALSKSSRGSVVNY